MLGLVLSLSSSFVSGAATRPTAIAHSASRVRATKPSLRSAWLMCVSTVFSAMKSTTAISRLLRFPATRAAISRSRAVSPPYHRLAARRSAVAAGCWLFRAGTGHGATIARALASSIVIAAPVAHADSLVPSPRASRAASSRRVSQSCQYGGHGEPMFVRMVLAAPASTRAYTHVFSCTARAANPSRHSAIPTGLWM